MLHEEPARAMGGRGACPSLCPPPPIMRFMFKHNLHLLTLYTTMKTSLVLALVGLSCVAAMCPNQCSGALPCARFPGSPADQEPRVYRRAQGEGGGWWRRARRA